MLTPFLWWRLSDDTEVFDVICQHDVKLIQLLPRRYTRSASVVLILTL